MKKTPLFISIVFVILIAGYILYAKFFKPANDETALITNNQEQTSTTSNTDATGSTSGTDQTGNQTGQGTGTVTTALYKDGSYTGDATDAFYGTIQVKVVVSGGKIADVQFLQFPNSPGHTTEVSNMALPILKSEAIQAQSAKVDGVSGATQTSEAFIQSISSALIKAKA